MPKVAYLNDTDTAQYVGGRLVLPNCSIEVDSSDIPGHTSIGVDEAQPAALHIVDVLLSGDEADLLAALPSLCDDDLDALGEREQQGAARQRVLGKIAEVKLDNANAAIDSPFDLKANVASLIALLPSLSPSDLDALIKAETEGSKRATLIKAAQDELSKHLGGE